MIYAIEAVRRSPLGKITDVRWHSVEISRYGVLQGPSEVVDIETAVQAAEDTGVHVCYRGATGTQLRGVREDGQPALRDHPEAPAGQRLMELPTF